jgi:iron complex transport system substrate-binding protein
LLALLIAACSADAPAPDAGSAGGKPIAMAATRTFSVSQHDGYRVVDIEANVVAWGGTAGGPPQRARLVLVARGAPAPPLTGPLAGAMLVRTPVLRLAVNDQSHEAMVRALGIADRLAAVGGHDSFDDSIRARVKAGAVRQIGYGWHQPPLLDALVAAKPDLLVMKMADLTHTEAMERVAALGIPVLPTFIDAEPHYMGRADWIRLMGLLTGREREADALVEEITANVAALKGKAAAQPRTSLLWAWYASAGDRWQVTQRGADAALIRDANAEVVLGAADDPKLDSFSAMSTETLITRAGETADCWMMRDPLSTPYRNVATLKRFRAWRDGCVFWQPGRKSPNADAWELWEMGMIRPDWQLADIVKMTHPALRDGHWHYLAPEQPAPATASTGH